MAEKIQPYCSPMAMAKSSTVATFRADNPALTARTVPTDRQPLACILTSRLPQPTADFQLLRDRPQDTVFFVSPAACASTVAHALGEKGVRVFSVGPGINGRPFYHQNPF